MHDGRFKTLEEVVEHYNSGIKAHPNLSGELKDRSGNPIRLNLSAAQKGDMVAFFKTLTDNTMATNPKWSDPFPATTATKEIVATTTQFQLGANYPNPFNQSTTIPFTLNTAAKVTLKIFDLLGSEIAVLATENRLAGNQSITINNGGNSVKLNQGTYIYQLIVENNKGRFSQSKLLVVQ
jgi:hypothetical protein